MTSEQKRIAIAEALGYTHVRIIKAIEGQPDIGIGHHPTEPHSVPDYLNDLNAMHDAVHSRITSPFLQQEYFYQLNDAIGLVDSFSPAWIKEFAVFAHSQATATQHAEAFGKTLNLW
jgi:hypothetical protein